MDINHVIAENLKRLRLDRNLSLGQLADLSKVSKVMLSQIEKGDANPTINTLWKIANGLKVPYTALMEKTEPVSIVVKKSEITVQADENEHYRIYCYYSNTPQRNFELFQIELDAGHSHISIGHSEKSQEYIMVLDGELTLALNNQTYVLHSNDAISFTASVRHTYASSGSKTLIASIINYYPV